MCNYFMRLGRVLLGHGVRKVTLGSIEVIRSHSDQKTRKNHRRSAGYYFGFYTGLYPWRYLPNPLQYNEFNSYSLTFRKNKRLSINKCR